MKILHVAESAKGGVGTYIAELVARQLDNFGQDTVCILAPADHVGQFTGVPASAIVSYDRPDRSVRSLWSLASRLSDVLAAYRPDVIHAHSTFAGLIVRLMYGWRSERPAIVYCPHGWGFDVSAAAWKRRIAITMEQLLAPLCDRIIAISAHEGVLARRIGIPAAKIEVVRNGLSDVASVDAKPWSDDRLRVLFVGRLDRQKGFDTLMDALAPINDRVSVRVAGVAVAGGGEEGGAAPRVEMLGWLDEREIRAHLQSADVLVVPSRWEGFGLVAVEAMRAARMVVASNVGGLREVVRDGVTGWLVPAESPVALAQRLARITRGEAHAMGANGRRDFVAFFKGDRMHRQIQDVYRHCLSDLAARAGNVEA